MFFQRTDAFIGGFVMGLGTGLVIRELGPRLKSMSRPFMKGLLQTGMKVRESVQGVYHGGLEFIEDMVHEAKDTKVAKDEKKIKRKVSKTFKRAPLRKSKKTNEVALQH